MRVAQCSTLVSIVALLCMGCHRPAGRFETHIARQQPLTYSVAIPADIPRLLEMPEKDGTTTTAFGREWYAANHRRAGSRASTNSSLVTSS